MISQGISSDFSLLSTDIMVNIRGKKYTVTVEENIAPIFLQTDNYAQRGPKLQQFSKVNLLVLLESEGCIPHKNLFTETSHAEGG